MNTEVWMLTTLIIIARMRLAQLKKDERGAVELTTIVIITGLIAVAAIAIIAIIVAKLTSKANNIPTE